MADVRYDIETQAAAAINNVGGNQNYYNGEPRRRFVRWVALLGVALSLSGLAVLVFAGVTTALDKNFSTIPSEYKSSPSDARIALISAGVLLVAGFVIKRFVRAAR